MLPRTAALLFSRRLDRLSEPCRSHQPVLPRRCSTGTMPVVLRACQVHQHMTRCPLLSEGVVLPWVDKSSKALRSCLAQHSWSLCMSGISQPGQVHLPLCTDTEIPSQPPHNSPSLRPRPPIQIPDSAPYQGVFLRSTCVNLLLSAPIRTVLLDYVTCQLKSI